MGVRPEGEKLSTFPKLFQHFEIFVIFLPEKWKGFQGNLSGEPEDLRVGC